ncbi:MAG: hypothetical protein KAQ67_11980 [Gammaproteobacteria bacterium]|nr:hypothetical protein [Gammaproteobacteria bacterium]
MKNSMIQKAKLWLFLITFAGFFNAANAGISITPELQNLLNEANAVNTQLTAVTFTEDNVCNDLLSVHQSTAALIKNIEALDASLISAVSVDEDSLQAQTDLSAVAATMAAKSKALSIDLNVLNSSADMVVISDGITAMLRLSDDIGIMADRILEMADKILIMADNIGIMADRIIVTQQIQSENLALTQASILATQKNSLALISVTDSNTYNVDLNVQTLSGNLLAADISATPLSVFNMAREWSDIATDVASLKHQVEETHEAITEVVETNTLYAGEESFTALADMSIMVNSIGVAMQGLALATQSISPFTRDSTLDASMESILQMSADIGVMANRILEMADLILAMADNIGLTADQIIATQQLQSTNYAATLASVDVVQGIAVIIITTNSL